MLAWKWAVSRCDSCLTYSLWTLPPKRGVKGKVKLQVAMRDKQEVFSSFPPLILKSSWEDKLLVKEWIALVWKASGCQLDLTWCEHQITLWTSYVASFLKIGIFFNCVFFGTGSGKWGISKSGKLCRTFFSNADEDWGGNWAPAKQQWHNLSSTALVSIN